MAERREACEGVPGSNSEQQQKPEIRAIGARNRPPGLAVPSTHDAYKRVRSDRRAHNPPKTQHQNQHRIVDLVEIEPWQEELRQ